MSLINTAICIASLGTEQQRRAYNVTFQENGRALVEMHLGNFSAALRLLDAGLARLDEEVDPGRFAPHRSVLMYNRAKLLSRIGSPEEALRAYDAVIGVDPNYSEYYVERAEVHRQLGAVELAFSDYETAIRLSPPYPQTHFNRGDLAMEQGDLPRARSRISTALLSWMTHWWTAMSTGPPASWISMSGRRQARTSTPGSF
ncbi:tetratricopeptide repeat protein [Fodinicola feengrottensis]|uniref:tetratricopeptide repeat protein n=1 Tax=Fodinicola feengrottensis TaxID=435914 RepID=UPI00244349DF|nr:tetratricopeptide repeat protein [Fodinicola feengrottensis]